MKNETLLNVDNMRIDYFYEENLTNKNLAFVFSPSMNRNLEGNTFGGEVFIRNGFDVVSFKVSNDDWFQSIPCQIFDKIKHINSIKKYIKRVSYGSSMGGYGAIAFSKILNCSTTVAFSPQYCIDEDFDTRWASHAAKIIFKFKISTETVKEDCNFFLFYDSKDADRLHVDRLKNILPFDRTVLTKLPFTGHPSVHYLSEVGLIKDILLNIIYNNSLLELKFFEKKRMSKSYLHNLSLNLQRRKHFNWALFAINEAIKLDSKVATFYRHRSVLLERLGKIIEAIEAIREAISLDSNNSKYINYLSKLLSRLGFYDEAIEFSRKSIALDPTNAVFYSFQSNLLLSNGSMSDALLSIELALKFDADNASYIKQKQILLDKISSSLC